MRLKNLFTLFLLLFTIVFTLGIRAQETETGSETEAEEPDIFEIEAGTKAYYSSGLTDASVYYKPFLNLDFKGPFFEISPNISSYINYEITNGYGDFDKINLYQPSVNISITPFSILTLEGLYKYTSGEYDYTGNNYGGSISFDFDIIDISGEYEYSDIKYSFYFEDIEEISNFGTAEIAYYLNDNLGFDLSYDYSDVLFRNLDYTYKKQSLRLGATPSLSEDIMLMLGGSYGITSDDYNLYGGDISFIIRLFKYVKASGMLSYTYYSYNGDYTVTADSTSSAKTVYENYNMSGISLDNFRAHGPGNSSAGTPEAEARDDQGSNPFMKSSLLGKSFSTYNIMFGLSLEY